MERHSVHSKCIKEEKNPQFFDRQVAHRDARRTCLNEAFSRTGARRPVDQSDQAAPLSAPSEHLPEVWTLSDAVREYAKAGGETRFAARLGTDRTPLSAIDQTWAKATEGRLYPNAAASTRNRQFWTPLISVLRRAAEHGYCDHIPLHRPRSRNVSVTEWLTANQAQALVDKSPPHLVRLLLFMLCTGTSPSEAIYLDWSAINVSTCEVSLLSFDQKVLVGLPRDLVSSLAVGVRRDGPVFRRQDGYPYVAKKNAGGQVKTALRAAAIRAGLRRITLGDIERTWAIWFLAMYGPDELLRAGRWSSPRSVSRYKTVDKGKLQELRAALQTDSFHVCRMFRETRWSDFEEAEP